MALLKAKEISYPFTSKRIRSLRVGDNVLISGRIATGRDRLHRHLYDGRKSPVNFKNGAIFRAGPVVVREAGAWVVKAAGPTTSMRHESYMPKIIERRRIRVIIGKGGMGEATRKACQKYGCVYVQVVGGAASVLAKSLSKVSKVHLLKEFGAAEAVCEINADKILGVVTMDSRGKSLHRRVNNSSRRMLEKVMARKFEL